jgi:hypothetical protein
MTKSQANGEEPVLSRPARKKTLTRVQRFLEAYRTTASVAAAAQIAGIHRAMHYQRLERDPAYQKAFARAKGELSDTIEGELFRRDSRRAGSGFLPGQEGRDGNQAV